MRHGTHEKQLSNVFAWLLDVEQTHHLGDAFQRIFVDEVNRNLFNVEEIPFGPYGVKQEQNTAPQGERLDIADLVLESETQSVIIENYHTSSGHGHSFQRYRDFGSRDEKQSIVVLLCQKEDRRLLVDGWQGATVVTYTNLIAALSRHFAADEEYQQTFPQQSYFIEHLHRRFVKERRVNDEHVFHFLEALCTHGEAHRLGRQNGEAEALRFAAQLEEEARVKFNESRVLLGRVKKSLRAYARSVLIPRVNAALGVGYLTDTGLPNAGIFEWTINLYGPDESGEQRRRAQLKFGPSAWKAYEDDPGWEVRHPANGADYSRIFVTCGREVRQSSVGMHEVLEGLPDTDTRLGDELIELISAQKAALPTCSEGG